MDDDTGALQQLRNELADRGWRVRFTDGVLNVSNPGCGLNDEVTCEGGQFRWPWAPAPIGPIDDVPAAADRIMHVLRTVDDRTGPVPVVTDARGGAS
jgi:hypothetical protein